MCYNQNNMHKGDGFTIIEVTMFLAISGALLSMALLATGSMARQNRFTDTINTFQAYMQRQYEEVQSGVNTRQVGAGCQSSSRPGADSCILIGKVVSFMPGQPFSGVSRYVRSNNLGIKDNTDIYNQLRQTNPEVLTAAQESFELQWEASVQEASRASAPLAGEPVKANSSPQRALINSVAFLRGPNSSQIVSYYFYARSISQGDVNSGLRAAVQNAGLTARTSASVCVHNTSDWTRAKTPVAAVMLGNGRGTAGIASDFQPARGAAGVCQ